MYDAEGRRVAKLSGTTVTNQYLLGQGGEQISELDGQGNWLRTNAYVGGRLLATYDEYGLHFHFTDWLGTRRVQVNATTGAVEETCLSLPYGDSHNCSGSGSDATRLHFTGKERDTESGNDYFEARYYGSNAGRFMSPDPSGLVFANPANPQTLNLYSYVANSPLIATDPTGLGPCDGENLDATGHCNQDFSAGNDPMDGQAPTQGGPVNPIPYTMNVKVVDYSATNRDFMKRYALRNYALFHQGSAPGKGRTSSNNSSNCSVLFGSPCKASSLPSCLAVGAKRLMDAGADTYGNMTDAAGMIQSGIQAGAGHLSEYMEEAAVIYAAARINTKGFMGLITPMSSQTYRDIVTTSEVTGMVATNVASAFLLYNEIGQAWDAAHNPIPCKLP